MANTIGFGQAAINNTIDYGQGATDNTINWGKSQTLSPSGETNITGTGGTPPFSNTKSIALDGVDDFVNIGTTSLGITNAISISAWVKIPTTNTGGGGTNIQMILNEDTTSGTARNWALSWRGTGTNNWQFYVYNTNGSFNIVSSSGLTPNDGNWHHLLATYDGTTNTDGLKLYVDGASPFTATASSTGIRSTSSAEATIGATSGGSAWRFEGNIDEVAVWNSDQSSNVASIYNGGEPNDISSLSPLSWWRCGDGDTAPILSDNGSGGNDGTMTNFTTFSTDVPTASSFANTKSILLDGVDDYVDCGNAFTSLTSFSVSAWFKSDDTSSSNQSIISSRINSIGASKGVDIFINNNQLYSRIYNNGATEVIMAFTDTSSWHQVVLTYDGTTLEMYLDNVSKGTSTGAYSNSGANWLIGKWNNGSNFFNGNIDEVAVWNSAINISDVWNGSGVPFDISSSNPLSWWRCGDGDTAPTLTDNGSGGNDGTMTNFTTFSTDVPT